MRIPYHIKQETIWIVRGYEQRRCNYNQMRGEILGRMVAGAGDGAPHGTGISDQTAQKAEQIDRLERYPEVKKMRAVEYAERQIGQDVLNQDARERLRKAIVQNCKSGRRYPFERLAVDEFSRRDFYRRKDKFLVDVASFLEMM